MPAGDAAVVRYHWIWGILNESGARRQSQGLTRSTPVPSNLTFITVGDPAVV
ncbi:hypothetical protein L841_3927 [Mycobacterium sp. MAC_080597_8934]|nr:hypothetical protein L840_2088 [Mycobacterium sp. MAC_011194_8550]ETZ65082.1 hypothetical protein L841_3932 [Mycobacterium sp. MAC_080597_8934]ETZ65413.1 hypothetical protein L841_3927 [Mycobacterium sp. MAC_080597_8934]